MNHTQISNSQEKIQPETISDNFPITIPIKKSENHIIQSSVETDSISIDNEELMDLELTTSEIIADEIFDDIESVPKQYSKSINSASSSILNYIIKHLDIEIR